MLKLFEMQINSVRKRNMRVTPTSICTACKQGHKQVQPHMQSHRHRAHWYSRSYMMDGQHRVHHCETAESRTPTPPCNSTAVLLIQMYLVQLEGVPQGHERVWKILCDRWLRCMTVLQLMQHALWYQTLEGKKELNHNSKLLIYWLMSRFDHHLYEHLAWNASEGELVIFSETGGGIFNFRGPWHFLRDCTFHVSGYKAIKHALCRLLL